MRRSILVLASLLSLLALEASADVTFGASVTNADGELRTTLTWDAPGASGCVGSGHPEWAGDKTASGTQELPAITLSGTYQLTISCTFPGDRTARLTWVNPTTNTDGTALTNLAGTRIHYGRSADVLNQTVQVANPSVTTYTLENLDVGQWFFAVRAYNTNGVESALSNVVTKTLVASTTETQSVSLTVNPIPSSPTDVAVE